MRIRSTKPEFWRSKTIAQLPWDVRLVLKGLESYVDDNGVGKDDIALIAADVFPRDLSANPRETLARLSEAITMLDQARLIVRYEVDGEDLLYIDKWKSLQRIDKPAKGRFPRPDGTFEYAQDVNRDSYPNPRETLASPPETLAPVTGEQGNRGTGASLVTTTPKPTSAPAKNAHQDTRRIVHTWQDSERAKNVLIPTRVLNDATAQVQALVNDGIPPEQIARGLAIWWEGEYPPSTIPNYVARAGQPKDRRATGTNRAADILAIDTTEQPF